MENVTRAADVTEPESEPVVSDASALAPHVALAAPAIGHDDSASDGAEPSASWCEW